MRNPAVGDLVRITYSVGSVYPRVVTFILLKPWEEKKSRQDTECLKFHLLMSNIKEKLGKRIDFRYPLKHETVEILS